MNKKGQVALEFIMTYGWAILVVLAAIAALAYFGVLNPAKYFPEKCLFSTGVGCNDFVFQDDSGDLVVKFTIINNLGDGINFNSGDISAEYKGVTVTGANCAPDPGGWPGPTTNVTVAAEDSQALECTFAGLSPGDGANAKAKIEMIYMRLNGAYDKVANGEMSGTVVLA